MWRTAAPSASGGVLRHSNVAVGQPFRPRHCYFDGFILSPSDTQWGLTIVYVYSKLLFCLLCLLYIKGNDLLVLFVEQVFS